MAKTKKVLTPREAREKGGSRRFRNPKPSKETAEEKLLREGGWRAIIINPGDSDPFIPHLVLFEPPSGMGLFTKEQAVRVERSKPEPTGEMLEPVEKGSHIPHDPENGIPWVWGEPPRPKQKSKRQIGRERSVCRSAKEAKSGKLVKLNRAFRRRRLQRR